MGGIYRKFAYQGEMVTIRELSERTGIARGALYHRIEHSGMTVEAAVAMGPSRAAKKPAGRKKDYTRTVEVVNVVFDRYPEVKRSVLPELGKVYRAVKTKPHQAKAFYCVEYVRRDGTQARLIVYEGECREVPNDT